MTSLILRVLCPAALFQGAMNASLEITQHGPQALVGTQTYVNPCYSLDVQQYSMKLQEIFECMLIASTSAQPETILQQLLNCHFLAHRHETYWNTIAWSKTTTTAPLKVGVQSRKDAGGSALETA